jgi:hypothetical protein
MPRRLGVSAFVIMEKHVDRHLDVYRQLIWISKNSPNPSFNRVSRFDFRSIFIILSAKGFHLRPQLEQPAISAGAV